MENSSPDKLFYAEEHLKCSKYMRKVEDGFMLKEIPRGDLYIKSDTTRKNHLIAVISGSIEFMYEEYPPRVINAGEIFVLSRSAVVHSRCIEDAKMIILIFEIPTINCEKINFQELREMAKTVECKFNVLPVRNALGLFYSTLEAYLKVEVNCAHLHALKQDELLLCLRYFYTKEELAALFYPMLYKTYDFRHLVLENYEKVKSVKELIDLSHMSKSVFFAKFQEEFGVSAKQWLITKLIQKIEYAALEPDITVKELMLKFNFDSLSSFQRFCKDNTGQTPLELINRKFE